LWEHDGDRWKEKSKGKKFYSVDVNKKIDRPSEDHQ